MKGLVANQLSHGRWYTRKGIARMLAVGVIMAHRRIQTDLDAGLLRWGLEPRQGQVGRSRILYARAKPGGMP